MKTIKIKAELPVDDMEILKRLSYESGISMTDVIRKALWTYDDLRKIEKRGHKFLLQDRKGYISVLTRGERKLFD